MSPPLVSPFGWEAAAAKVRAMEDSWNSREPDRVARDYTIDSFWRSRVEFLSGRATIESFLMRKWVKLEEYRRINELWALTGNRMAVRFAYEYQHESGNWHRAYGNENWELDPDGLIRRRIASMNSHAIVEAERMFLWPAGRRPDDYPELSDFDF
jgi:nuclear transport factor 2 (NTF2) superfamily protein